MKQPVWEQGLAYLESLHGSETVNNALSKLRQLEIEVPSWGFGRGGNRFATYLDGSEPTDLPERLAQAGRLYKLTNQGRKVALHFPWDGEGAQCAPAILDLLEQYGLQAGAINSNMFSQREKAPLDYEVRLGTFTHPDPKVRQAAVDHNLDCLQIARALGSKLLSVWVPDGSNSPGQMSLYDQADWLEESLSAIYADLQPDEKLLIEYKFFEPGLYSTAIADWGRATSLCQKLGPQAAVLVDLGHHPLGTNIEQIVALLLREGRLGGFHVNDKKYADDDLAAGSIDPAQLFRIFVAILEAEARGITSVKEINFTIDQSHCIKNPTMELIESIENIQTAFIKASLVDLEALAAARAAKDLIQADAILRAGFNSDPRPLLMQYRANKGLTPDPLA